LQSTVLVVSGGRYDVIVQCSAAGAYKLESKKSSAGLTDEINNRVDIDIMKITVTADSSTAMAIPSTLPARPLYLSSLLSTTGLSTTYDVQFRMGQFTAGEGRLNEVLFAGESDCRVGMKVNTVQQWTVQNMDSGRSHPFHMHINHHQIVSYSGANGDDNLWRVGDWRDTITVPGGAGTPTKLTPTSPL